MSTSATTSETPSIWSGSLFSEPAVKWSPHKGQMLGMKFLVEHSAAGLFADPGVGKTSITLGAFKVLRRKGLASKMLVVAPLKPAWLVWPAEVEKWTDFQDLKVVVLHGPDKEAKLKEDADVYVVNFDGLAWLLGAETSTSAKTGKKAVAKIDLKRVRNLGCEVLCIDELSKLKHPGSLRFKALKQALPLFGWRWGLTGSPASNGLMDLFGQCYVLDLGKALGQFVTHYRMKYFLPTPDGFGYRLRAGAEEEIYQALAPLVLRLSAEDYVDMPALVERVIKVELPPGVRALYDRLEDDLVAELASGKKVTAVNAAVASGKCRQIANGGLYLQPDLLELLTKAQLKEKRRDWVKLHDEKTEALEDLVDELQGQPVFVAYDFNHDLERLQAKFDAPHLGAGVSGKEAQVIEKAWNAGAIPLLLGHPQSVGHGLNLQGSGCRHVVWYGLTWNYELYDQFIRRVRRQGAKVDRVFVHHIVAKGTVDEQILWALRRKEKGQNALLDALQELRRTRRGRR